MISSRYHISARFLCFVLYFVPSNPYCIGTLLSCCYLLLWRYCYCCVELHKSVHWGRRSGKDIHALCIHNYLMDGFVQCCTRIHLLSFFFFSVFCAVPEVVAVQQQYTSVWRFCLNRYEKLGGKRAALSWRSRVHRPTQHTHTQYTHFTLAVLVPWPLSLPPRYSPPCFHAVSYVSSREACMACLTPSIYLFVQNREGWCSCTYGLDFGFCQDVSFRVLSWMAID